MSQKAGILVATDFAEKIHKNCDTEETIQMIYCTMVA
jgi:hypothetical protein